jgi:acyl-CoA synthetase (AMP-forming)/AMP-acid ligase II
VVDRVATGRPDTVAVVHGTDRITYAELAARIGGTAAAVAEVTEPGGRVAVIGDNHPVWVDCLYGVPACGRVLVFLNHRLSPPELASILDRSGATLLIGSPPELDRLRPNIPDGMTVWSFEDWPDIIVGKHARTYALADDAAPAWLIFTSGTTSRPKGAVLTHQGVLAAVGVTAAARPARDDDVYLFPFPLCHVAAYNVVHHHLRGRPVVLLDRFEAGQFAEAAARSRATSTSVAATMLSALLDLADEDGGARRSLATLRSVAYGASPMPLALLRRADAVLGVELAQGYGMTELSGNAVFLGPEAHRRGLDGDTWLLAAAGKPGPGVSVRVVDDDLRDVPGGEAGEIIVAGDQLMAGYWDDPGQTEEALVDGWLRTGDIGRWDADGWLYVVDRKKDIIVSGGENISSLEVEDILHGCAGVREAAVVGVPDARWGENVCAVVVARPGQHPDPAALVVEVRRHLAGFKAPRHVVFCAELPRNAAGKVVKAELRAWLAANPHLLGERC